MTTPDEPASFAPEVDLSKKGKKTFVQLVEDDVDACVTSKKLKTGCGLEVPKELSDGTTLKDGTLKRTMDKGAKKSLKDLTPELDAAHPSLARATDSIGTVDVSAECTQDGRTGTCELIGAPTLGYPAVDFSQEAPEVTWS